MRKVHRLVALFFIGVFVATGVYMARWFPPAQEDDLARRLVFRSSHVYIMFGALLNLAASTAWRTAPSPGRRRLQLVGSASLLICPAVFLAAFIVEPEIGPLLRPASAAGLLLAMAGTILHALGLRATRPRGAAAPTDVVR
jgi:hypothetical protein